MSATVSKAPVAPSSSFTATISNFEALMASLKLDCAVNGRFMSMEQIEAAYAAEVSAKKLKLRAFLWFWPVRMLQAALAIVLMILSQAYNLWQHRKMLAAKVRCSKKAKEPITWLDVFLDRDNLGPPKSAFQQALIGWFGWIRDDRLEDEDRVRKNKEKRIQVVTAWNDAGVLIFNELVTTDNMLSGVSVTKACERCLIGIWVKILRINEKHGSLVSLAQAENKPLLGTNKAIQRFASEFGITLQKKKRSDSFDAEPAVNAYYHEKAMEVIEEEAVPAAA